VAAGKWRGGVKGAERDVPAPARVRAPRVHARRVWRASRPTDVLPRSLVLQLLAAVHFVLTGLVNSAPVSAVPAGIKRFVDPVPASRRWNSEVTMDGEQARCMNCYVAIFSAGAVSAASS
jgi:hypothetical protein